MERYCSSTFWDSSITWYTTDPDFTQCFEKTALLWSTCAFLWLTAIVDIYTLANPNRDFSSLGYDIPTWRPGWTWLTILKILIITLLIILEISVFCVHWYDHSNDKNVNIFSVPDVLWTTPIVLIVTHFLSAALVVLHKFKCVHTSGIQLIHWSTLSLIHILIFRTALRDYQNKSDIPSISLRSLILLGCSLFLMLLQSFIFCWSDIPDDKPGDHSRLTDSSTTGTSLKECPIVRCSCLNYILFAWSTPLVLKGYKTPLTTADLWDLITPLKSRVVFPLFNKYYGKPEFQEIRSIYRNIIKPLWLTCGWSFMVAFVCKLIATLMSFLSPKIMGFIMDYVRDKEIEHWKGYLWAGLLFVIYTVITIFWEQFYLHMFKCYVNVLTCLNLIIYRKSMNVSSEARKDKITGEIVNLMSVDVEAIRTLLYDADSIWSAPIQVLVGVILLWFELGIAVLPGIGVLLSIIPINWYLTAKSSTYQRAQMKKKDERIKVISEVLSGIQVIKLYAWEPSFLQQIKQIRDEEVTILRKRAFCQCGIQFVMDSVPFMVSVAAFFTFVWLNGGVLDPKKAFTSVTLFTLLTDPICDFPSSISALVDARVSFQRVNNFLNAEEIHPDATQFLPKGDPDEPAVEITDGTFAWEEISNSQWKLCDINLEVEQGSLMAIVGSVASGKSSLLAAILGDMKYSGEVIVRGKVAYVPQIAWILNATLRENICFGLPFDSRRYYEVIECCSLAPDIEILPAGDMTEIGEKGINLSGGQKQRVSLARAAYSQADVLLLDDVLSAVDAHVGRHIFDRLLGPSGLLKGRTRILCTHAYQYLSQVDQVVVLDKGRIVEMGSYEDLLDDPNGNFAHLVSTHVQSKEIKEGDDPLMTNKGTSMTPMNQLDDDASRQEKGKLIEEERLETGDVKLSIFMVFLKAMGYPLVVFFVLAFASSEVLGLGRNIILGEWTTVTSKQNLTAVQRQKTTSVYFWEYGTLGIIQSLFYLVGYFILAIASLRAAKLLHNNMLQRILKAPMSFFNVTLLGRVTNRFSSDVESVDKKIPGQVGDFLVHLFKILGIILAISIATNIYFLVFIVPLSVIYYVLQRLYILCMQQLQRILNALKSPIYAQFQETLNGTSTVRAYKAEERFIEMLGKKLDNFNQAQFPHLIVRRWLSVQLGILGATVMFVPALFAVIWRDTLEPSMVGLSISYAVQFTSILSWLIKVTSYLQYNFVSVERILEYSEVDQEADFENGRRQPPQDWPRKGSINFIDYETRYRPGLDLVLKHFTCQMGHGEKIGIVGRTGAGKSSLTLAIFRIIEATHGEIEIDGVNIADVGLHQVRRRLTVIPQDPVLFSRSLRMNLDPFEEYEDDKIWECLEMAHLKKWIDGLDEGLEYHVSEGGENLSVGQRQLVCLARAILRKSPILILDEATASVDSVTDELIQKTIREYFGDCTILNVAHRLNTVLDSSRILVLNRGEIVEFDTPQNLLANRNSHFYGMAKDAGIV